MIVPLLAVTVLAQTAWKPYTLPGGMQVELPSPPKVAEEQTKALENGGRIWYSMHQGTNAVVVAWIPLPKNDKTPADEVLANMVAGNLAGADAQLTGQKDIVRQGWPGLEAELKLESGFALSQVFVTPEAMFQVGVFGPTMKAIEPPARKAFASIRLPKPEGTMTKPGPRFESVSLGTSGVTLEMPGKPKEEKMPLGKAGELGVNRFTVNYGNRSYIAAYVDVPDEQLNSLTPDNTERLLQEMNADVVRSLKGQDAKSSKGEISGASTLRTTFVIGGGQGRGRVETLLHGTRLLTFMTLVPTPLADAVEVRRFFSSVQLPKE